MSVQTEIDRVKQNIANTYAVLSALGADLPSEKNSDNLPAAAGSAKAVLYAAQTLTEAQKAQARENIGALSDGDVGEVLEQAKESGEFDGAPGKSAYAYAQDGGYTGTEAEFAEKLAQGIPTKTSQLTNDAHFVTSAVTDKLAQDIVQLREDLTAEPLEEVDTVIRYAADGASGTTMPEFVGLYINQNGAIDDAQNQYQYLTKAIPILPNTVITYKLIYLTSQQVMAFYDADGNYISGVKGTTNNTPIEGTAEIPENAKMVVFNFRYPFDGLYAQVKYTTEGTPTITETTITSSVGIGDIKTSGTRAYSSSDGSFVDTSAYEYVDKIAIDADVISVTCFGKGAPSVGLAVFFDKSNAFLSALIINSSVRIPKAIYAPDGAAYVGFSHMAADAKAIYYMTTIKYEERGGGLVDDSTGTNHWLGKKWYAFGTSITDTSYTNAETGSVTGKYVPYLVSESGMIVTNYGKAGGCIASGGVHGGAADILARILATDVSEADLITLEGFVNDFACAITIGDVGDMTDTTLCGALYQAINYFQKNSHAVVALITEHTGKKYTLSSTGNEADYTINKKNSINKYQSDYNEAIRKMARHMGCWLIDAGAESQINENHPEYLIDHLHHTELGGQQYAKVIWSHLKDIPCMVTNKTE